MSNSQEKKLINIKSFEILKQQYFPNQPKKELNEKVQMDIDKAHEELKFLSDQKEKLITDTEKIIEQEKRNWEKEKQNYIEAAKEQGYKEGFSIGKEESVNQYKQLLEKANAITEIAIRDYHTAIDKSEETIIELAVQIAKKVLMKDISSNRESFLPIVTEAIKEIKDQPIISIYIHPNNYEFVIQQKDELARILEDQSKLSIYINDDLNEGDCIIGHSFGQIDAGIDTQLSQIRHALQEIVMENKQ